MELSQGSNLVFERTQPTITVARFTRPDVRSALDGVGVEDCKLYQEISKAVLSTMSGGEILILNFGLIHYFPTSFYQFLLTLRDEIAAKKSRMILCCFTPEAQDGLRIFRADRVFEIAGTEEQAIRRGMDPSSAPKS